MGESFIEPASVLQDMLRNIFSFLDRGVYWLLSLVYQLFFNVASADLFANETIMNFYGRVQLIIGVFMMFQLAMTILKGIMNPDSFTDSKSGAGNLITRIITALVLLTVLVPVNFGSPRNEYEIQINNNGLLFGTLYSLQHRILSNNTIGRLILGKDADSMDYLSSNSNESELKKSSRIFASTILKGFYRINLLPEDQRPRHEEGKDDAVFNDNRICKDIDDELLNAYTRVDAEPGEILSMVTLTCDSDGEETFIERIANRFTSHFSGNDRYILAYIPFWSTVVGIIFVFILLSFTVDIAVRAVKLAVLRLIAPIPIISYMDPKGSKDNAFSSWVKALTSTYLDLFIRLASVYFVIFIIQDICQNGLPIMHSSGILGIMTAILIFIGLFVFAKQAPKFIKEVLGLKGDTPKLFGGIQEALSIGAIGAGAISGGISRGVATRQQGGNLGKSLLTGIAGGVSGGWAAGKSLWNAKDYDSKALMNQIRANNAKNYSNTEDKSTFGGRLLTSAQSNLGLKNQYQLMEEQIKYYTAANDAMTRMVNSFGSNGDYKSVYSGPDIRDGAGNIVLESGHAYSLKDYKDKLGRVQSSGNDALIEKVDSAMKSAQQERLSQLRQFKTREELAKKVQESIDNGNRDFTQRDLDVYDAARTIYGVASKYSDEPAFSPFLDPATGKMRDFDDAALKWGTVFKTAASTAGETAKSIKASGAYDKAKADAQRVADNQKK